VKYAKVGVIGAGVIGVGVAQTLAQTGHSVVLVDISENILNRARSDLARDLRFAALFDSAARQTSESEVMSHIQFTTDYDCVKDSEFIVENSTESWDIKRSIYPKLDRLCRQECIFAANTSAISITRLAGTTQRPDRVIGMHFMNPVPQKPVVEVIKGWHTSEETIQASIEFLRQLRKRAVIVNDMPGFVSNRVLMLTINEAVFVVQDKVATPEDVDEIFVNCFAHKMGPLATADLIGLDTVLLTLDILYQSYGDSKYRACPLLRQMIDAGLLGRKSGKGFFQYTTR